MPRKPEIAPIDLENELRKWPMIFNKEKSLQPEGDSVWANIKAKLKLRMRATSLYLYVYSDRHFCRTNLENFFFKSQKTVKKISTVADKDFDPEEERKKENLQNCEELIFNIQLPAKQIVESFEKKLKKNGWTDTLARAIWDEKKLPCAYNFKSGWIKDDDSFKFSGCCTECNSSISGEAELDVGSIYNFEIVTLDTCKIKHIKKRKLKGDNRSQVKKTLLTKTAGEYREEELEKMETNYEPPHLNTSSTLSKVRQQGLDEELGLVAYKGCSISSRALLKGCGVHKLSLSPFYLWYWLHNQMVVWNFLQKLSLPLSLDASGSLVKKYNFYSNAVSKTLFVYIMVIGFCKKIIPICQMISSIHDVTIIQEFLTHWIECGALVPKEIVTDGCLALMIGICLAFNKMTLKYYKVLCFRFLKGETVSLPLCFIGHDVAHLLHAVRNWKCFKTVDLTVIEFYMHCIGYLTQIESLEEFEEIVRLIIIVAASNLASADSKCYKSTIRLLKIFKIYKNVLENLNNTNEEREVNVNEEKQENDQSKDELTSYIDDLFVKALSECDVSDQISDNQNFYECQDFINNFQTLCKSFVLWTSCMRKPFSSPNIARSSARSEANFRIEKERVPRPVTIQKFILRNKKRITALTNYALTKIPSTQAIQSDNNDNTDQDPIYTLDLDALTINSKKTYTELNDSILDVPAIDESTDSPLHTSSPICIKKVPDSPTSHSSSYMGESQSSQTVSTALKVIPVNDSNAKIIFSSPRTLIINGLRISRKEYVINNDRISLKFINTCPFDSTFELLTSAVNDNPTFATEILKYLKQNNTSFTNSMLDAVINYKDTFDQEYYYAKRAQLLYPRYKFKPESTNTLIHCEENIIDAVQDFLNDFPSFYETIICHPCKSKVEKSFYFKSFSAKKYYDEQVLENLQTTLQYIFSDKIVVCSKCHQKVAQASYKCGSYLLFDVEYLHEQVNIPVFQNYVEKPIHFQTKFKKIPYKIQLKNEWFQLSGLVAFEGDEKLNTEYPSEDQEYQDSYKKRKPLVHYKTYVYSPSKQWILYNDLKESIEILTQAPEDQIAFILYTKTEEQS